MITEKKKKYLKEYQKNHREKYRVASKKWRQKNPSYLKLWQQEKRGDRPYYPRSSKTKEASLILSSWERRKLVLRHYGAKCMCCGESELQFLAIDHINGGGTKHRRLVGDIVKWVIRQNYPKDIQLLCHNCNQAKGYYGKCPHTVIAPPKSD